MKKYFYLALLAIIVVIFDLSFGSRLYSFFILAPVILVLLSLRVSLEEQLIFAAVYGFIFDSATLAGNLYMTIFLIAEVIIIHYIRKNLIEFKNKFVVIFAAIFFSLAQTILVLVVNRISFLTGFALRVLAINIICAILVIWIYYFAISNIRYRAFRRERREIERRNG